MLDVRSFRVFVIFLDESGMICCVCDHEVDPETKLDAKYRKELRGKLIGKKDKVLHVLSLDPEKDEHFLLSTLMACGEPDFKLLKSFGTILAECYQAGYIKNLKTAKKNLTP